MGILRTDKISGLETPTPVTGSVNFPGSDDYITAPANTTELLLNDNDFTIEGWFYKTNTGQQDAFGLYQTANNRRSYLLTVGDSSTIFYYNYTGSSGTNVTAPFTLPLNKWAHVAITRDGTTLRIYVDGKLSGTTTGLTSGAYANTDDQFMIGSSDYSNANGSEWTGHISNLRIVRGYVLYDGDFTVPDHALEVVPGTVLLACNNPDSVTAASYAGIGTSITLTAVNDVAVTTVTPGLTRDFTYGTEFRGVTTFDTQGYFVPPSGTTEQRGRGRGLFGGGDDPSATNSIDYVNINSTGNAQDFGDLIEARDKIAAAGSSTRGLFAGGDPSSNTIAFVTLATTGNALNFGDLPYDGWGTGAASNDIRWLNFGDYSTNRISYVTMSSLGDAQDFGDLLTTGPYHKGCGSSVRAIIYPESGGSDIQYLTFATLGNAVSFGEKLDSIQSGFGAASDSTRAIRFGGRDNPGGNTINSMGYVTIASTGNAQDFGDLTSTSKDGDATSNSIRAVHNIGYDSADRNAIDYVTIQTTGNAKDFGDLTTTTRRQGGTTSDSHGGIG